MTQLKQKNITRTLNRTVLSLLFGSLVLGGIVTGCGSSLTDREESGQTGEVVADEAFSSNDQGEGVIDMEGEVAQTESEGTEINSNADIAFEDDEAEDLFAEDPFAEDPSSGGDDFDDFAEDDFSDEGFSDEEDLFAEDPFAEEPLPSDFADSSNTPVEERMENTFEESLDESFNDVAQEPVSNSYIESDTFADSGNEITSLEYDSELSGGSVIIRSEQNMEFNTRFDSQKSQYIVDIQNTSIPEIYKRPMFMKDFGQNLVAVSSYENGGSARIIIQVKNGVEPSVAVNGSSLTISPGSSLSSGLALTPGNPSGMNSNYSNSGSSYGGQVQNPSRSDTNLADFTAESSNFSGERISLQVNDEDVTTVINFIADQSGANIVIGPGVSGKVTMKLRNIPWDQALMTIMKSQGLGYIRTGNVLRIGKLSDLQKESDAALKIRESQNRLEPVVMKVIPLKYAQPEEVKKKLEVLLTKERGHILSDLRTSSVIVSDTISVIDKMSKLIHELDLPPPQVLIESKIVEASKTFTRELGLRWGLRGAPTVLQGIDGGSGQQVSITPSLRFNDIASNVGSISSGTDPLSAGLRIGSFDFLGNIEAVLNLKEQEDQLKVISSPRVVTLNNQEASITQSTELIRTRTVIIDGQATQEPVTVPLDLVLKVTPQITTDASIMLDVDVKREFPGVVDQQSQQSPKNSRQAKTKILVDNNKTAVIGGIYQNDSQVGVIGVPWLKDIPLFGWLFKTKTRLKQDTELMIFITPRILDKNYQSTKDNSFGQI